MRALSRHAVLLAIHIRPAIPRRLAVLFHRQVLVLNILIMVLQAYSTMHGSAVVAVSAAAILPVTMAGNTQCNRRCCLPSFASPAWRVKLVGQAVPGALVTLKTLHVNGTRI